MFSISVQTFDSSVTSKFKVGLMGCEITVHKRYTKRDGSKIGHVNLNTGISIVIRVS
jgi:hypothetical protein